MRGGANLAQQAVGEQAEPEVGATTRIGVIVVDDNAMFLDAICLTLSRQPNIDLLGAARDTETTGSLLRRFAPAVAIVDVRTPGLAESASVVRSLIPIPRRGWWG